MKQNARKLGLVTAVCTLLSIGASEAVVTLTFTQSGPNVTATWSGSYDLPAATSSQLVAPNAELEWERAYGMLGAASFAPSHGNYLNTDLITIAGTYVGQSFGYIQHGLVFPVSTTGVYSPTGTMTFANQTLTSIGAAGFNNQLVFQGTGDVAGSRTIVFNTVPEPSSALLSITGVFALTLRRRRSV